jgi:acetyl esterase
MPVDTELAALLTQFPELPDPSDPVNLRAAAAEMFRTMTGGVLVTDERIEFRDEQIPGPDGDVPVRIYQPRSGSSGCLVYLHGGGFILGDLDSSHLRALMTAAEADCTVISVGYRLSPEHPFPAPVDDCYAALVWTHEQASSLGVDPARLAVGGDSAGGGLAAALTLMARDRGGPAIAFQHLIYPVIDDRMQTASMAAGSEAPVWDTRKCEIMWQHYLGSNRDDVSSYAAPGRANDLTQLPPAYILTAECDPLRDEGIEYASRLLASGVSVELHNFAGAVHGFDILGMTTAVGQRAFAEEMAVLRQALAAVPVDAA